VTLSIQTGLNALSRAWRAVRVSVRPGGDISRGTMPPCAQRHYAHLWPPTGDRWPVRGAPFDEPMESST
jgi:hypothetical protein